MGSSPVAAGCTLAVHVSVLRSQAGAVVCRRLPECTRRDLNPHTLRYRNLKGADGHSMAADGRERTGWLDEDGHTRSTAATRDAGRDSRDTVQSRDRIRLVRAVLRSIDQGRVDKARKALVDLLDELGQEP